MPDCIKRYVAAATRTSADIVTSVPFQFRHDQRPNLERDVEINYLPIGSCVELGAFENCFGDANALVSRRAFEIVGGFHEDYGKAVEDWQFFATAVLSGLKLEVVPEPQYWYRIRSTGMLNRSNLLENHRRIINVYRQAPISVISNIIEGLIDIESQEIRRLNEVYRFYSQEARDMLWRMSNADVNSLGTLNDFRKFCVDSGFVSEALDFALYNQLSMLPDVARESAERITSAALDVVRGGALEVRCRIDLTQDARQVLRIVSGLPSLAIKQPGDLIACHPIGKDITVLKAAAVCPPETLHAIVRCSVEAAGSGLVAIVVCGKNVRMDIGHDNVVLEGDGWWSGWTAVSGESGPKEVFADVSRPAEGLLDLLLLARGADHDLVFDGVVRWERLECVIAGGRSRAANILEITNAASTALPP